MKGSKISAFARRLWSMSRDLYRATPAVTQGLGFCGLIPIRPACTTSRGYWGGFLTQVPIQRGAYFFKQKVTWHCTVINQKPTRFTKLHFTLPFDLRPSDLSRRNSYFYNRLVNSELKRLWITVMPPLFIFHKQVHVYFPVFKTEGHNAIGSYFGR